MAVHAYVFVEGAAGEPIQVADTLRNVPGVEMAHAVAGAYDVIAFVQAESVAELGELLSRHIHRLPGVLKTTTNVAVPGTAAHGAPDTERRRRA